MEALFMMPWTVTSSLILCLVVSPLLSVMLPSIIVTVTNASAWKSLMSLTPGISRCSSVLSSRIKFRRNRRGCTTGILNRLLRSLLIFTGICTPFLVLSRGGDSMPCSNPSLAYFPIDRKTGRRSKKLVFVHSVVGWEREYFDMSVSFIRNHEFAEPYLIPCGKCLHCLMMRARDWSFRCQCEYDTMGSALFLTLTYNDEHLPLVDGVPSLQRRDMQLFLKSLRKRFDGQRLSYFGCGEYGGNGLRPHYHIMVFGLTLDDLVLWKRSAKGFVLFRSATIENLWSRGFSTVEPCTSRTIDYVTRYSLKKASQDFSSFPVRPFTACSKRPAIGLAWFNFYGRGLVKFDSDGKVVDASVLFRGTPMPLPRYFLKRFGLSGDEVLVNGLEDYRRSYRNLEDFSDLSSSRLLSLDDLSVCRFRARSSEFDSLSIPDVSASADNARYGIFPNQPNPSDL